VKNINELKYLKFQAIILIAIVLFVNCNAKSLETKSEKKLEEKKQDKRGLDSFYGLSPWESSPLVVEKHYPIEKHVVHKEFVPVHTHSHSVKHVPIVKKEYVPYPVEKHVVHKEFVPVHTHSVKHVPVPIVKKEFVPYPVEKHVVHHSPTVFKSYSSWPSSYYSDYHF
jgi:hypothetical protein